MRLQITELSKLAKIAFGCRGIKAELADDFFCCNLIFIGHKFQNIDHFLCQGWLYRPFIDHFLPQFLCPNGSKLLEVERTNWSISVCRCWQCSIVIQSIKTAISSLSRVSISAWIYSALSSFSTLVGNTPNSHCSRFISNRQVRPLPSAHGWIVTNSKCAQKLSS